MFHQVLTPVLGPPSLVMSRTIETSPVSTPTLSEARVILWNGKRTIVKCPRCSGIHEHAGTVLSDYTDPPIYVAPSTCLGVFGSPSSSTPSLEDAGVYNPRYPSYYEIGTGYDSDPYPYFYSPSWLNEAQVRECSCSIRWMIMQCELDNGSLQYI